jgi:hypothetical protein
MVTGNLLVMYYCGGAPCVNQDDFGTRTSPYVLDLPWGNIVGQRLHTGTDEDWYAVDLAEAEHLSVNAWGPYILCPLELRLYADDDQPYYNCDGACTVPSGAGEPQYVVRQVGFGANFHSSNLHMVAEKAGRYYVRVSSADAFPCSYTLSVAKADLGGKPLWAYQTPGF